jgi:hypothetical protein
VCDKKASECDEWNSSHYRASDKGTEKNFWKAARSRKKNGGAALPNTPMPDPWAAPIGFGGIRVPVRPEPPMPTLTKFPTQTPQNRIMLEKMKKFIKIFEDFVKVRA